MHLCKKAFDSRLLQAPITLERYSTILSFIVSRVARIADGNMLIVGLSRDAAGHVGREEGDGWRVSSTARISILNPPQQQRGTKARHDGADGEETEVAGDGGKPGVAEADHAKCVAEMG